jgi:heme/copper-type cytochrome/quinol oxidase subunit 1
MRAFRVSGSAHGFEGLPELAHALDGQADTAQRFVVVVALGLTLGIVASYLTSLRRTGWYAYAPLSGQVFQQQGIGEPGWLRLIIWLAAISLWALASLRVLRQSPVQATPK